MFIFTLIILFCIALFIAIGAVQIAFAIIVLAILWLCWCHVVETVRTWLKKYDS